MTTRLFFRNSQTEPGTGTVNGAEVYDLNEVQGSPTASVNMRINDTAFVATTGFTKVVDGTIDGTSFPTSVNVPTIVGTLEYRWRVQRVSSGGTVQASSDYSPVVTTAGVHTATLTLDTAWQAGDRLRVMFELRRTGGHGNVEADISTQDANSFVDATFAAAVHEVSLAWNEDDDATAIAANYTPPPPAPTGFTAVQEGSDVRLDWTSEGSSFEVARETLGEGSPPVDYYPFLNEIESGVYELRREAGAGDTEQIFLPSGGDSRRFMASVGDPGADGEVGDYVAQIQITSGNTGVDLSSYLERYSSDGNLQASSPESDLVDAGAGLHTFHFNNLDLGPWSEGDRLAVRFVWWHDADVIFSVTYQLETVEAVVAPVAGSGELWESPTSFTGIEATTYLDSTVIEGETYRYRVREEPSGEWSAWQTVEVVASEGHDAALSWTEADDAVAIAAEHEGPPIAAELAWTEDDDATAIAAEHEAPVFEVALAWAEDDDTTAIAATSATPTFEVGVAWTEAGDSTLVEAEHTPPTFTAALDWTEDSDVTAIEATAFAPGFFPALAWTEQDDTVALEATHTAPTFEAEAAWTEQDDEVAIVASASAPGVNASLEWTEDDDVVAIAATTAAPVFDVALAWTEADDVVAIAAALEGFDPETLTAIQDGADVRLEWAAPAMVDATHAAIFRRVGIDSTPFTPSPEEELARVPVATLEYTDVDPGAGDWSYQVFPVKVES